LNNLRNVDPVRGQKGVCVWIRYQIRNFDNTDLSQGRCEAIKEWQNLKYKIGNFSTTRYGANTMSTAIDNTDLGQGRCYIYIFFTD
jgi:hypothetical protein